MLLPDRRLLIAAGLWLLLGLAVAVVPGLLMLWQAPPLRCSPWPPATRWTPAPSRRITVQRDLPHAMPVGTWQTVGLRLSCEAGAATRLAARRHPAAFLSEGLPLRFTIASRTLVRVSYRVSVSERGRQVFDGVTLRCSSPLRLWLVQESVALSRRGARLSPISHASRTTRCWRPTTACRRSASCNAGGEVREWNSSSCATTARTTRRGRSTGKPVRASAA
jgi:uncharacterized protein (DUF58 family)